MAKPDSANAFAYFKAKFESVGASLPCASRLFMPAGDSNRSWTTVEKSAWNELKKSLRVETQGGGLGGGCEEPSNRLRFPTVEVGHGCAQYWAPDLPAFVRALLFASNELPEAEAFISYKPLKAAS